MMGQQFFRPLRFAAVALALLPALLPPAGAEESKLKGQRIFICGHSFHVPIANPLQVVLGTLISVMSLQALVSELCGTLKTGREMCRQKNE